MKRSLRLSIVVTLMLVSLACSGLPGGGGSSTSGVDITIENQSPDEICYVLISPSSDDSWGDDRLGGDEVVEPGDSRVFNMPDDTYDIRVETCDEAAMATAWEIDRDYTIRVGDRNRDVRLLVINESTSEVCYVLVSPSSADDWGEDWLGGMESLPPNQGRMFYVEADTYDLQAVDCDDNVLSEEYQVDLTSDLTWRLSD